MWNSLVETPLFALGVYVVAYAIGVLCYRTLRTSLANPVMVSTVLVILFLTLTDTPFEKLREGGNVLILFLGPATAALALTIYRQRGVLRRMALPIVLGCLAGCVVSLVSVWAGCRLLGVDLDIMMSLLPKSVTSPIAIGLSQELGGVVALTAAAVCVTGVGGAVLLPGLCRLFGVTDGVALGVGFGTTCHAIGTARAVEMGEVEGAISGISIGMAGLITTVLLVFA